MSDMYILYHMKLIYYNIYHYYMQVCFRNCGNATFLRLAVIKHSILTRLWHRKSKSGKSCVCVYLANRNGTCIQFAKTNYLHKGFLIFCLQLEYVSTSYKPASKR